MKKEIDAPLGNILKRSAEVPLDIWNCVVPRNTPSFPPIIGYMGFIDGMSLPTVINAIKKGDIETALFFSGIVVGVHYLAHRACGDWRHNRG